MQENLGIEEIPRDSVVSSAGFFIENELLEAAVIKSE